MKTQINYHPMKTHRFTLFLLLIAFAIVSCKNSDKQPEAETGADKAATEIQLEDPLPSWNEGEVKSSIIDFVKTVTDEGSTGFVPVEDRIATFDNDGNLWAEKPAYFQLFFALDRIKQMAPEHPEWKDKEPYKSVLNDDMEGLSASGLKGLLELVMVGHGNMTEDQYRAVVKEWLEQSKHPRFNKPYNQLIYQPMLELLDYLRANEFTLFIVSGGGIDFLRVWATEAYGIPSHQIVGSSLKSKFRYENGVGEIVKLPEVNFVDDKEGKPVGIHQHIGKKPIFASGNSDGDLQMLQYTDSNTYPSFKLYLHHTDSIREFAYDRESHVGKLDKGLDEAREKGWPVIDMKKDWKVVFPFEKNK